MLNELAAVKIRQCNTVRTMGASLFFDFRGEICGKDNKMDSSYIIDEIVMKERLDVPGMFR